MKQMNREEIIKNSRYRDRDRESLIVHLHVLEENIAAQRGLIKAQDKVVELAKQLIALYPTIPFDETNK